MPELEDTFQYLLHRTGPLAGLDILQFQGFINTKYADPSADYPDVQYQHIRFAFNDVEATRRVSEVTGFTDEVYKAVFGIPNSKAEIYMPLAVLQRPKSRGTIRLRNKDPLQPPVIDPSPWGPGACGLCLTRRLARQEPTQLRDLENLRSPPPGYGRYAETVSQH
ncbi:Uncharacterized protein GBIM_07241 [Gryllus bimaculatus]|nr:Uncharacterized protein GBIM_07241 [Gryllus bimaculatus]